MVSPTFNYSSLPELQSPVVKEEHIESGFIGKLQSLKHKYRPDITDRASLEKNFREKFESLNQVCLTDSEFARLLDEHLLHICQFADKVKGIVITPVIPYLAVSA